MQEGEHCALGSLHAARPGQPPAKSPLFPADRSPAPSPMGGPSLRHSTEDLRMRQSATYGRLCECRSASGGHGRKEAHREPGARAASTGVSGLLGPLPPFRKNTTRRPPGNPAPFSQEKAPSSGA